MYTKNSLFLLGSKESKTLNKAYQNIITNIIIGLEDEDLDRLDTYDLIVREWITNNDFNSYDEFKYRLTDGEDINEIFIDIIERNDESSILLITLIDRLENYINDDENKKIYE